METVNAITTALQGGPLGIIVGLCVVSTLAGCTMLIAKRLGLFDDDKVN